MTSVSAICILSYSIWYKVFHWYHFSIHWKLKRSFAVIWYSSKYSVNTGCFGITQTRRIIQTPFNTECLGNIDYVLGTFFALTGKTFTSRTFQKGPRLKGNFAKNIYDRKYFRVPSIFSCFSNHKNHSVCIGDPGSKYIFELNLRWMSKKEIVLR